MDVDSQSKSENDVLQIQDEDLVTHKIQDEDLVAHNLHDWNKLFQNLVEDVSHPLRH